MSRWIIIAAVLLMIAGLHPTPAIANEEQIPRCWDGAQWRAAPGRWYKVASHTGTYWPDSVNIILTPEPGMPQALGFASWDDLHADVLSLDGMISDVGLWYDGNFGGEQGNYLDRHPAGLVPEGQPYRDSRERWLYFVWHRDSLATAEQVYVRFHGTALDLGPTTPVLRMEIGLHAPADMELALYVKM